MATIYSRAILLLKLDDALGDVHRILPQIATATRQTTERLVIVFFSSAFNEDRSRTGSWDAVQTVLTSVYVESTRVAYEEDKILLDVDVLLVGTDQSIRTEETDWDAVFRLKEGEPKQLLTLHFSQF